jgi:ABC-type Fe3+ transport system substrate-binding protein
VQFPDQILYAAHPDWFVKLDASLLPDLKNIPAQYNFGTEVEPFTMPYVPTFNTNLVPQLPTTWKDLISPKFTKLSAEIGDPRQDASTMAFYQALYRLYGGDYLKKLGASYKLFGTIATALQDVAAGQAAFAMPSGASAPAQLIASGAPLKTVKMNPEIVDGGFIGIAAKAQDPDAALVFINWLGTEQGQKSECMNGATYTVIKAHIAGCQHTPSSAVVMTPASAEQQSAKLVSLLGLK